MTDTHRQRHGVPVRLKVDGEPVPLAADRALPSSVPRRKP